MPTQRTICITNFAGTQIAQFESVDPLGITGWELKCRLAEVMGFPTVSFAFVSAHGKQIDDASSLQDSLGQDACEAEPISISCVLGMQNALGPKNHAGRPKLSKAGEFLSRRLERAEEEGSPVVKTLRIPNLALRDLAEELIRDSFAPELKELIGIAVEAAYQQAPDDASSLVHGQHVFKDAAHGVCVDLSSCRLWMSVVDTAWLDKAMILSRRSEFQYLTEGLVSTVLWRLLEGWTGAPADSPGGQVRAGPVLEVLFLATSVGSRQWGEAKRLVAELEAIAGDMGCAAVAVAAVPMQGRQFWKRCGYQLAVPLAEAEGENDVCACRPGPGLGEPASALGEFLRDRMLVFNDTPLVAKILKVD